MPAGDGGSRVSTRRGVVHRPARILYGENHTLTIEGFRSVVGRRHKVLASVGDGLELVDAALHLKPDIVALGISVPRLNGIEAARLIKSKLPETKVLFITRHNNPACIQAAFAAGADGYVLKSDGAECILEAIEKVVAGEVFRSQQLAGECTSDLRGPGRMAARSRLTARERTILQQVAEGRASKEIAASLGISAKTVTFHRENIKRKLGVRTTSGLTKSAMQLGLISPPESD